MTPVERAHVNAEAIKRRWRAELLRDCSTAELGEVVGMVAAELSTRGAGTVGLGALLGRVQGALETMEERS